MDKLNNYRALIQQFLIEQSQGEILRGEIESETIFDVEKDRYLLVDLGWDGNRRIYNCVIHLEIRSGKIWIQRNQTDQPIADVLISMGVAADDLILGMQPPSMRQYTGFGVA